MATRIWDPYTVFNITSRNSRNMFCVGQARTKGGSRCRFHIEGSTFDEVTWIISEIEKKPPNEISELLPQLARLCLCEDYHRYQARDVQRNWERTLEDVVRQYEKGKRLRELEERNNELNSRLAEQSEKVRRLEQLLEELDDNEELISELQDLQLQLDEALSRSRRYETTCAEAAENKTALLTRISQLETSLADDTRQSDQLAMNLARETAEKNELAHQLDAKTKALKKHEADAEASRASISEVVDSLRSHLAGEQQLLALFRNKLEEMDNNYTTLASKADGLQSTLATERQMSGALRHDVEKMRVDRTNLFKEFQNLQELLTTKRQEVVQLNKSLEDATTSRALLLDEMELLRTQLETERQDSQETKKALVDSQTVKAVLHQDIEVLQSEAAIERQTTKQLRYELTTVTEEKAALLARLRDTQNKWEQCQLGLTNSLKEKEEQKAVFVVREVEYAAESARMLAEIRALERQVSTTFLKSFWQKIRKMVGELSSWMASLKGRKQRVDVEMAHQGVE